jgi:hypothetical protein
MRFIPSLPVASILGLAAFGLTACSSAHPSDSGTGAHAATTGASTSGASTSGSGSGGAGAGGETSTSAGSGGEGTGGAPGIPLTRADLLANNTSASPLFTDQYTPGTRWNVPNPKVTSNGDAPASATTAVDMAHGVVSKVPMWKLLYPTATSKPATKIYAETQGWFCTNNGGASISSAANADQCGGHIDIGYDSNAVAHANAEVADMVSRGLDGAILDWSGSSSGLGESSHSTNVHEINSGNLTNVMKAAEATNGKFTFAVVEDEGMQACAGDTTVGPTNGKCPSPLPAAPNGCDVTKQIIADVTFIITNYVKSPAYQTLDGHPVIYFFGVDHAAADNCKSIDWSAVRAGITYTPSPVFVFEDAGGFTHAESGGAYAWPEPTPIASYPGSDPFDDASHLPGFYQAAAKAANTPASYVQGGVFKGFDDVVVNGWVNWSSGGDGNRYMGQQCGKTWLDSFAQAAKAYPASSPIAAIQIPTWDDYEEATEIETGIENYVDVTAKVSGSTLSWSIAASDNAPADCTTALEAGFTLDQTLDHYEVYASTAPDSASAPLTLVAGDIPTTTTSLDLGGKLPAGAQVLYVYAVGKPTLHNHLSPAVSLD